MLIWLICLWTKTKRNTIKGHECCLHIKRALCSLVWISGWVRPSWCFDGWLFFDCDEVSCFSNPCSETEINVCKRSRWVCGGGTNTLQQYVLCPRTDWQASASGGRNSVLWNVLCLSRQHKLLPQVIALLNMPPDCTWRTERTTSGWWGNTSSDWRGCGKHCKKGAAKDNRLSLKVLPGVLISPHHMV